jgi:hypothetical protein
MNMWVKELLNTEVVQERHQYGKDLTTYCAYMLMHKSLHGWSRVS